MAEPVDLRAAIAGARAHGVAAFGAALALGGVVLGCVPVSVGVSLQQYACGSAFSSGEHIYVGSLGSIDQCQAARAARQLPVGVIICLGVALLIAGLVTRRSLSRQARRLGVR